MSRQGRLIGVVLGLCVALVIVFLNRPPADAPHVDGTPVDVVVELQPANLTPVRVEIEDPPLTPAAGSEGEVRGRVVGADSLPLSVEGRLYCASLKSEVLGGAEVVDGQFSLGNNCPRGVLDELVGSDFVLSESDGVVSRAVSLRWDDASRTEMVIEVAEQATLSFRVVDLRGDPVSGARFQVGAPVPISIDGGLRTDADGLAQVRVRPTESQIRVRVLKDGYIGQSFELELDSQGGTREVALSRFVGAAVVIDRRFRMYASGSVPGSIVPFASAADWRHIADAIEARSDLEPYERVEWIVVGEENDWLEALTFSIGIRAFDEPVGKVEVPVLHITDPDFVIHRGAEALVDPQDAMTSIDVAIEPADRFLAEPPDWLGMTWELIGEDYPSFVLRPAGSNPSSEITHYSTRGRHLGGGRYRYWLPPGRYGAPSTPSPQSKTQGTPVFLSGQEITVTSSPSSQALQLAPTEQYVTLQLVDEFGFDLDIASALTVALPVDPTFWPARTVGPYQQWMRPGEYSIWGMELHGYRTIQVSRFVWPQAVGPKGIANITVNLGMLGIPLSAVR